MAKLKTRTNQPVNDSEGLLDHLAQNGNTTEIGGNLEVDGQITANGGVILQPYKEIFELGTDFTYNSSGEYHFTPAGKSKINYLLGNFSVFVCDISNASYVLVPATFLLFNNNLVDGNSLDLGISINCMGELLDKYDSPVPCEFFLSASIDSSLFYLRNLNANAEGGYDFIEDVESIILYGLIRV